MAFELPDAAYNRGPVRPTHPDIETARSLFRSNQLGAAEQQLSKILATEPGNAEALSMLGLVLAYTGRPTEAAKAFKACLSQRPNDFEALSSLSHCLNGMGSAEEAAAV